MHVFCFILFLIMMQVIQAFYPKKVATFMKLSETIHQLFDRESTFDRKRQPILVDTHKTMLK